MADRTSAEVFGAVFDMAADYMPDDEVRGRFVRRLWSLAQHYDFAHEQMECDEALVTLGLARREPDPEQDSEYANNSMVTYADGSGELPEVKA